VISRSLRLDGEIAEFESLVFTKFENVVLESLLHLIEDAETVDEDLLGCATEQSIGTKFEVRVALN